MLIHHLRDYSGPIHVCSHAMNAARCVRLQDGRFHVFQAGSFSDLMDGPDYILLSPALAESLRRSCGSSLDIVPAQVIDVRTGRSLAQLLEVRPHEELTPETLRTVDATGSRAWHFRKSHLFVTKQVVLELQQARLGSLQFSPGFTEFAGDVASADESK
jgi:hypothetical protein